MSAEVTGDALRAAVSRALDEGGDAVSFGSDAHFVIPDPLARCSTIPGSVASWKTTMSGRQSRTTDNKASSRPAPPRWML